MSFLRFRRTVSTVAVVLAVTATLAACTATIDGKPHAAGEESPVPTRVPEPEGPLPSFGESVTLIESRRLAYATPRPDVIDPAFTNSCLPTYPAKNVEALGGGFGSLFLDDTVAALKKWGFVAAFVQCRSDPGNGRGTVAAAIEMRDENSALGAVQDMVPTLVEENSDATAEPLGQVDGGFSILDKDTNGRHVMQTIAPYRRLVLYQYSDDNDAARLASTAIRTLTSALERAEDYEPTPLDEMSELQDDPHKLRPLVYQPDGDTFVTSGGYSLEAYFGIAVDPVDEVEMLRDAGYAGFYTYQAEKESYGVYELRDDAAMLTVLSEFEKLERRVNPGLRKLTVPGVPAPAFCAGYLNEDHPVQRCFFGKDKYLWQIDVYDFAEKDLATPGPITAAVRKQLTVAPK